MKKRPSVTELIEEGKWMDAAELVQLITRAREDVEADIHIHGFEPSVCRDLHDVTLACTIFGYLPPIRLTCIWSLLHPLYQGECLYDDCSRGSSCKGNRLVILSEDPLRMQMHLPHHKCETAWDHEAIYFDVPYELAQLMLMWVGTGHLELCQELLPAGDPPLPFVFINSKGVGFSTSTLGRDWKRWIELHGGVPHLPPSMCRHIFVEERMSARRVEGPADRGAAMAMGNTVAAWERHYHKQRHFHPRECQQAVDSMQGWREHLLGAPPTSSTAATPQPSPQVGMAVCW